MSDVKQYEVGQKLWVHLGGKDNPLVETNVVMVLDVPGHGTKYLVEHFNSIDWALEVRDWFSVSETAEGPINLWKRTSKKFKEEQKPTAVKRCPNWPKDKTDCGLHNLQCGYPSCLETVLI